MGRPIVLFSSRRSGSTLLAETIASQPGMTLSDQPFELWHKHPHSHRIPWSYESRLLNPSEADLKQLKSYADDLFSGRIQVRMQWKVWDPDYHFFVNRVVFKVLSAKQLICWFDDHFDLDIAYSLRHPVPFARSVMKRGWGCLLDAFLRSEAFTAQYLTPHTLSLCRDVLGSGTELQKLILEWALDNLVPLRSLETRRWPTLTYEELLTQPEESCEWLASRFGLPAPETMLRRLHRPSASTLSGARRDIQYTGPTSRIASWLGKVAQGEVREAMALVTEIVGREYYSPDDPYPHPVLRNFG